MNIDYAMVIAGAIGIAMGFLFAISGFNDPGASGDLSRNPRVRNLIWLLGGAGAVVAGDWKLILPPDAQNINRSALIGSYTLAAIITIFISLSVMTILIYKTVKRSAEENPEFQGAEFELIGEYLQGGYKRYKNRQDEIEKISNKIKNPEHSMVEYSKSVAIAMAAAQSNPNNGNFGEIILNILRTIESISRLFLKHGAPVEIKVNYMVRFLPNKIANSKPILIDRNINEYDSFLIFRRYMNGAPSSICLPVESSLRKSHAIPGAPTCALEWAPQVVNTREVICPKGMPLALKKDIERFYKQLGCASVMSVPLVREQMLIGIVNIESSQSDIVGRGPGVARKLGEVLAPLSLALAEIVRKDEKLGLTI